MQTFFATDIAKFQGSDTLLGKWSSGAGLWFVAVAIIVTALFLVPFLVALSRLPRRVNNGPGGAGLVTLSRLPRRGNNGPGGSGGAGTDSRLPRQRANRPVIPFAGRIYLSRWIIYLLNKLGALIDVLPDGIKWMPRAVLSLFQWHGGIRSPFGAGDNETSISSRTPMPLGSSEKISLPVKFPGSSPSEIPRRASIDSDGSRLRPQSMHTASVSLARRSPADHPPVDIRHRPSYSSDRPYIDSPILESGRGRRERSDSV